MPAQGFTQDVRRVAANRAGLGEVVIQGFTVGRMYAVIDDQACSFTRCQAAQIRQALLGYKDVHIMLCMVHVADHWHNSGDRA